MTYNTQNSEWTRYIPKIVVTLYCVENDGKVVKTNTILSNIFGPHFVRYVYIHPTDPVKCAFSRVTSIAFYICDA